MLDIIANEDESTFVEALLDSYQQDDHPQVGDELREIVGVTKQSVFNQIAAQLVEL